MSPFETEKKILLIFHKSMTNFKGLQLTWEILHSGFFHPTLGPGAQLIHEVLSSRHVAAPYFTIQFIRAAAPLKSFLANVPTAQYTTFSFLVLNSNPNIFVCVAEWSFWNWIMQSRNLFWNEESVNFMKSLKWLFKIYE